MKLSNHKVVRKVIPKGSIVVCNVENYGLYLTQWNHYELLDDFHIGHTFYSILNDRGKRSHHYTSLFLTEEEYRIQTLNSIIYDQS